MQLKYKHFKTIAYVLLDKYVDTEPYSEIAWSSEKEYYKAVAVTGLQYMIDCHGDEILMDISKDILRDYDMLIAPIVLREISEDKGEIIDD